MTEIRFYHLVRHRLEDVLPQLLEKSLERGWRAVVMAGSEERAEALTQHLWTWPDRSFLPHGNKRDGQPARQPIWLTADDENPNGAAVLFLTDGARSGLIDRYSRVCELFDGTAEEAVTEARSRWRAYRAAGHEVSYWQEDEAGRWQQRGDS